jgi:2-oxoisovalerate dehydrogenase E2 component (dihydrolipoyl transacylase)
MGRFVFKLPDVGEGTAEAELVGWHVKVGDTVAEDQIVADVMTDKATVEITAPVSGKVIALHGEPGAMVPVRGPLVEFEVEGAGNADEATPSSPASPVLPPRGGDRAGGEVAPKATEGADAAPTGPRPSWSAGTSRSGMRSRKTRSSPTGSALTPAPKSPPPGGSTRAAGEGGKSVAPALTGRAPGERPSASPAVRNRARDLGVDLTFVPGSGPAGRITHEDLDGFIARGGQVPASAPSAGSSTFARAEGATEVRIIGLRRKIAEKMADSVRRIPHITYVEEIDVTALEELRAHLNATKQKDQPKLNLLPFLARAIVVALRDQPQINAHYDDEAGVLTQHAPVHLGIAAQTPNGLMVPVVRHAEARDAWDTALEIARVSGAAKDGSAKREELSGSTITITSLGTLGGVVHTPIINHPEVAIVGPNKIAERVVVRDGQMVVRKMMNLSSSFDHRIVDGHDAAVFIQRIKGLLEHPATLWMG